MGKGKPSHSILARGHRLIRRWAVLAGFLFASGCGLIRLPEFRSEAAAVEHLERHRAEFVETAELWLAEGSWMFCYHDEGRYRWDDSFIRRRQDSYEILNHHGGRETGLTLDEAAVKAGTTELELNAWIDRAKALRLYCVTRRTRPTEEPWAYVEFLLAGSDWSPYGFRYAPENDEVAKRDLAHAAREQRGYLLDVYMRQIDSQWFYFVGKR
jgi:hypothetical protein